MNHLDYFRQHAFPGRYAALIALSLAAGMTVAGQPTAPSGPVIWSAASLDPLYKKADPRPQQLNLVFGRVDNALKKHQSAELPKAPPPVPTKGKGAKAGGKLNGFMNCMSELFTPPPPNCHQGNSLWVGNMGIGGLNLKKPEPG